ncbi:MAG: hypothetical protein O3B24_00705 [Verrucomicrobia bacterium]|nr:hypothetical protein [Verrucomicrobiota bacterium]
MKTILRLLSLFVALAVTFCSGCATNYSDVVRFTPSQAWDSRTSAELHADVNADMPFEIAPGDFVANKGFDGPSCWVCLSDDKKTSQLLKTLRRNGDWKVTSVSQVRTDCRPMFGLAREPGTRHAGRTAKELQQSLLAANDRSMPAAQ